MRQLPSDSPNCPALIGTHLSANRRSPETRVSARVGLWLESPSDNTTFPRRITGPHGWPMQRMRRRGDRLKITNAKYAGQLVTIENKVYERTVDYPDEYLNDFNVMLDTEGLVTVRWEQMDVLQTWRSTNANA